MKRKMILIRGLPGSGKSTRAKRYGKEQGYLFFESDTYLYSACGRYRWSEALLAKAKELCLHHVSEALDEGKDVVVAGVFPTKESLKPYLSIAGVHDLEVTIEVCHGKYKDIHDVPAEALDNMKLAWEDVKI